MVKKFDNQKSHIRPRESSLQYQKSPNEKEKNYTYSDTEERGCAEFLLGSIRGTVPTEWERGC